MVVEEDVKTTEAEVYHGDVFLRVHVYVYMCVCIHTVVPQYTKGLVPEPYQIYVPKSAYIQGLQSALEKLCLGKVSPPSIYAGFTSSEYCISEVFHIWLKKIFVYKWTYIP